MPDNGLTTLTELTDTLIASLAPVLRTLAKVAQAQHAAPPVLVAQANGTLAILPAHATPRAQAEQAAAYQAFLADELRAYQRDALKGARIRAHQYTQRPRRPQILAARRRIAAHPPLSPRG